MDIRMLRAEVEASGPRTPGRRFSGELRSRLVRATQWMWQAGEALADIADALGIAPGTAARYLDAPVDEDVGGVEDDSGREESSLPPGALVPITITESLCRSSSIRVTTPSGYVVEGLDVEGAVELLRALS